MSPVINVSSILLAFSTLSYAFGIPALHPRSSTGVTYFSSLSKRQDVPTVGDSCPDPGASPFDIVCAVEVSAEDVSTVCSEVCCYLGEEYLGGCPQDNSCMISLDGVLLGCCPGPDPEACSIPTACVDADEEPVGDAVPCPSGTPFCYTSLGVPGCSISSVEDTPGTTSTVVSATTATDVVTSETSETSTTTDSSTATVSDSSTSTDTQSTVTSVPTTKGTKTVSPLPEATGEAEIISVAASGFLVSWLLSILML